MMNWLEGIPETLLEHVKKVRFVRTKSKHEVTFMDLYGHRLTLDLSDSDNLKFAQDDLTDWVMARIFDRVGFGTFIAATANCQDLPKAESDLDLLFRAGPEEWPVPVSEVLDWVLVRR